MQKERGFRVIAIIAICLAATALSIGYASLSQTLQINGTSTVKGNNWAVAFQDGSLTVTPSNQVAGATVGASSTSATLTGTTLSFTADLTTPGDTLTYDFVVENGGSIDAKLASTPVLAGLDTATAQNVTYTLTYADGSAIAAGDELLAGETKSVQLVVTFNATATTLPTTDQALSLSTTLNYVQK